MRIKSIHDIDKLGPHARAQIETHLRNTGGFQLKKRAETAEELKPKHRDSNTPATRSAPSKKSTHTQPIEGETGKKNKPERPSRVMRTNEGLIYCPWPSTDPFVAVYQRLEAAYGRYDEGGLLLTELILAGGAKPWRFDFALLPPITPVTLCRDQGGAAIPSLSGRTLLLIEADGFGFHRSKDAFKNDRRKQTHALTQGFVVKRITNDDARNHLDDIMREVAQILSHERLYTSTYHITPKGKTQSVFCWEADNSNTLDESTSMQRSQRSSQ